MRAILLPCTLIFALVWPGLLPDPGLAGPSPPAVTPAAIDLPRALAEALAANNDLAAARAATRAEEAAADEAAASRWPRLDLTASYGRTGDVMSVPAPPGSPIDPAFFTGWREQWGVRLLARQILFSGGELSNAATAAREGARAAALDAAERERAVAFQVKDLFYRLLLAQHQVAIAREQLANARSHMEEAGRRLAAGDISRFELLRARVRAANLEQPLAAAERARGETAADLSRLMGRDPDPLLAAEGELAVADESLPAEASSARAAVIRPAVEAAAARRRQAAAGEAAAEGPRWPRLSFTASYDTRSDDTGALFTSRRDNWTAGLALDYSIFDAGAARAREMRAAALLAGSEESLSRSAQGAALDRRRAILLLNEARASRASASQTVAEAEEALAIVRVGYRTGSATNLEVADAETGLAAARTRQAEADYRLLSARAQWDYATGAMPPEVPR
jgi:outer membrane protein TolC